MSNKVMKITLISLLVLALLTTIAFIGVREYKKFQATLPSFQQIEVESIYSGLNEDYTYVIMDDEILELDVYPKLIEENIYLPIQFVVDKLNSNFYWDSDENTLTYTTLDEVIRMETDDLTYYVNSEPLELNMPITYLEDGEAYMPSSLLIQFSEYDFYYNEALDLLIIENPRLDSKYGYIVEDESALRVDESDKSEYIKKLSSNEKVKIISETEEWYRIRTLNGIFGYVEKDNVSGIMIEYGESEALIGSDYNERKNFDGKLNLVWHQVTNVTANSYVASVMEGVHGVDVLSPTWFEIVDSEGNISNIADIEYVNWAHDNGYQVWALFKCFDYTHSKDVLSSTEKREKVIKQILALASIYEVDGINVDFETIYKEDGEYFVQFIKELAPYLKSQGLVLSVDMYVPSSWTAHYNRTEVGKVADYIMVMCYDEHWSTSPESGSVASINFVENGIVNTLKEVPEEKVVLGLPYYTRLWKEVTVDGETKVSSSAYGMERAYNTMISNGAEFEWDEEVAQYYAEYTSGDTRYRMWLEDERSIEEKVKILEKYDVAGVAGWKLSLEKDEVWDVLDEYLD